MKNLRKKYIRISLASTLLVIFPFFLTAAKQIPTSEWQQIIQDDAFSYRDLREIQVVTTQVTSNPLSKIITVIAAFFLTTVGKSIVWILLFLLIIYFFFKAFWKENLRVLSSRKDESVPQTDLVIAQGIMETDWIKIREAAFASNDLRLAIRCVYMQLLQLLQQKKVISYRSDKTNQDYYFELKDQKVKQVFRQLATQYEFVWYGNYPAGDELYKKYLAAFRDFKDHIL